MFLNGRLLTSVMFTTTVIERAAPGARPVSDHVTLAGAMTPPSDADTACTPAGSVSVMV